MIDFPAFRPRPPWLGPDLQTVRNFLVRPSIDLAPWPGRVLELPMRDDSGDRLVGILHDAGRSEGSTLAILIHGLTGCSESTYVLATARHLLERGFGVLRLNLRGAGPSRALCRWSYHAGRSQDIRDAIAALPPDIVGKGVVAVGYSLGGNVLLKLLGENGRASNGGRAPIRAAVAVSAPIALSSASRRFSAARNWLYQKHLLFNLKREMVRDNAPLDERQRAAAVGARTLYEFDDRVVAPVNGFMSAEDYYARSSSKGYLADVAVPALLIHADDDPWISAEDYAAVDWSANPNLLPLVPRGGGHVGFHGAGDPVPWHDRCIAQFFGAVLSARAGDHRAFSAVAASNAQ